MQRLNDVNADNADNADNDVNVVRAVRGAHSMFRNSARRFFSAISFS